MLNRSTFFMGRIARNNFQRFNSTSSNTTTTLSSINSAKSINNNNDNKAYENINLTNNLINETLRKGNDTTNGFYSSSKNINIKQIDYNPYNYATEFIVSDKFAGRSINVSNHDLDRAIYQLDSLVRTNRLKEISASQRFFVKPNKRRLAKRVANRKRVFESGIAKLFEVVRDAVRKGY